MQITGEESIGLQVLLLSIESIHTTDTIIAFRQLWQVR